VNALERLKLWAFNISAVNTKAESPYTALVVREDDLSKLLAVVDADLLLRNLLPNDDFGYARAIKARDEALAALTEDTP